MCDLRCGIKTGRSGFSRERCEGHHASAGRRWYPILQYPIIPVFNIPAGAALAANDVICAIGDAKPRKDFLAHIADHTSHIIL